mgnify:CR=1 FL=1
MMLPPPPHARLLSVAVAFLLGGAGCGQYVSADAALRAGAVPSDVSLAPREALSDATRLLHYAQQSLFSQHTVDVRWGGGDARHVDYGALLDSPEAQVALADALQSLAAVDPLTLASPEERQAYWYNLYNGWMVAAALSRLQDDPSWPGVSEDLFVIFDETFVVADGSALSLNQLEHGILRGETDTLLTIESTGLAAAWHDATWPEGTVDPRLHIALNCASEGCPNLPAGAWQAATLDADLDLAATQFVDHPGKGAGPDGISALFTWYADDFAASGGPEGFIQRHRTGGTGGVTLGTTLPYSWALNAAP